MTPTERLQIALGKPEPAHMLRAVVLELAAEGNPKGEITICLEKLLLDIRGQRDHQVDQEDAILDVLDGLAGWCHDDAHLLPEAKVQ